MRYFTLFLLSLFLYLPGQEIEFNPAPKMELKPALNHSDHPVDVSLELDVFGLSYHSNRKYDYNEVNPGLGLSLVFSTPDESLVKFSIVASGGSYKDSFDEQAYYALVGPRVTLGYDDSFHASLSLQSGYLDGSGLEGQGIIPFITVGYDWFDIGITGNPFTRGEIVTKNGEKEITETKVIAAFLKFRLLDF